MPHSYDLTREELDGILAAGLGVVVVQHVAADPWQPTPSLGRSYGQTAAQEAAALGIPPDSIVWCDLEGVDRSVPAQTILDYCNRWYDAVLAAKYVPGLYFGDACGLTGDQLYHRLRFQHYWSAYTNNVDQAIPVRGIQLKQHAYPGPLASVTFEFDVDVANVDLLGDRASMLVGNDWLP